MAHHHFTHTDRVLLHKLLIGGKSVPFCAEILDFHVSTVYRELKRGQAATLTGYSVRQAQDRADNLRTQANQQHRKLFDGGKLAEEEIGLTGVRFFEHKKVFMRYPRKYFCQWYKASVDRGVEEFVLQADEVEELAWVKVVDLKQNLKDNPTMYTSNFQHVIDDLEI